MAANVPIQTNRVILSRAGHGLPIDVDPETNAPVAGGHPLQNLLALDMPQHKVAVLAGRRDKGLPVQDAEAAANGKLFVPVALVRLLDGAGDVVPQADAVIEVEGQDEAAVGGEADVCDGRVVFVDEGAEALAGGGVPYSAGVVRSRENGEEAGNKRKGGTYMSPSVEQLTTKVPSRQKSIPATGSLCAGRLLIRRPARTSHRKTASS